MWLWGRVRPLMAGAAAARGSSERRAAAAAAARQGTRMHQRRLGWVAGGWRLTRQQAAGL